MNDPIHDPSVIRTKTQANSNETPSSSIDLCCSLCGAKKILDSETVRCVSSSTWQLSYKYMLQGAERTKNEQIQEISDPKEWTVRLCHDCRGAQYIEANVTKAKELVAKIKGMSFGVVVGAFFSGLCFLIGMPRPRAYYPGQVDVKATNAIGSIAWAGILLIGITVMAVCLVGIPILFLSHLHRLILARAVRNGHEVPPKGRFISFSQAAKRILSIAESNTSATFFGAFPLPAVPTAADCHVQVPNGDYSLQMTKHKRIIQVRYNGQKWGNRDNRIW